MATTIAQPDGISRTRIVVVLPRVDATLIQRGCLVLLLLALIVTSGCTTVGRGLGKVTANKYANARSGSVWVVPPPQLEPPTADKKIAYISFRNISDADIDLTNTMRQAATAQGWQLTGNPQEATYRLRASLRFFGEVDPGSGGRKQANALGGIVGAAVGVGTGVAIYRATDSGIAAGVGGGVAGGLAGLGISNASKAREWALIVDVVLEEKSDEPVTFELSKDDKSHTSDQAGARNEHMSSEGGTASRNTSHANATRISDYFPHGVRLSVWANQMNMREEEAIGPIMQRAEKVVKQMLPM